MRKWDRGAGEREAGQKGRTRATCGPGMTCRWGNCSCTQCYGEAVVSFYPGSWSSLQLWSHFEQVSSVLRKSQFCCFAALGYKFCSADLFSQSSSKGFTCKREQSVFWGSQGWQSSYKLSSRILLTLKSCLLFFL